jgi:hypothetical protein
MNFMNYILNQPLLSGWVKQIKFLRLSQSKGEQQKNRIERLAGDLIPVTMSQNLYTGHAKGRNFKWARTLIHSALCSKQAHVTNSVMFAASQQTAYSSLRDCHWYCMTNVLLALHINPCIVHMCLRHRPWSSHPETLCGTSQSQSYLTTDGQSGSLFWYQVTIWELRLIFLFPSFFQTDVFLLWVTVSGMRAGL